MIRSSLVAIQLPLLKGAKNVVRGEGMLSFYNDCGNCSIIIRICCVCG